MNKLTKIIGKEMEDVLSYEKLGYSRLEATKLVLKTRELLKYKANENEILENWNKGGFINDNKYKQPIKHKK
jgi:hypothetical protein